MDYARFKTLCGDLLIDRGNTLEIFCMYSNRPFGLSYSSYTPLKRIEDANNLLDFIFDWDKELEISEVSKKLINYGKRITPAKVGIPTMFSNMKVALAQTASISFSRRLNHEDKTSDIYDSIKDQIKKPYGKLVFPANPGTRPADKHAAINLYDENLIALLIARENDFEVNLPGT